MVMVMLMLMLMVMVMMMVMMTMVLVLVLVVVVMMVVVVVSIDALVADTEGSNKRVPDGPVPPAELPAWRGHRYPRPHQP
jgi:hypothetical protein